jgi:hypothetical protein
VRERREGGGWVVAVVQGIIIERIREGSRWPWRRWISRLLRDCSRCPRRKRKKERRIDEASRRGMGQEDELGYGREEERGEWVGLMLVG